VTATVVKLDARRGRQRPAEAGGPTVRAAIDSFLDSPDVRANPNTLRAYASVLDRVGGAPTMERPRAIPRDALAPGSAL
jgi:hypothetical protein